jgi:hypothetical protein
MGVNQLYQKLELELDSNHQKIIIENIDDGSFGRLRFGCVYC